MSVISSRSYNSRTEHVAPRLVFVSKLTKSGKIGLDHVPDGAMLIDIGFNHAFNSGFRSIMQQIKNFSG